MWKAIGNKITALPVAKDKYSAQVRYLSQLRSFSPCNNRIAWFVFRDPLGCQGGLEKPCSKSEKTV